MTFRLEEAGRSCHMTREAAETSAETPRKKAAERVARSCDGPSNGMQARACFVSAGGVAGLVYGLMLAPKANVKQTYAGKADSC